MGIIHLLQRDGQPFILPVILRGKLEPPGGTPVLLVNRCRHWTRYTIKSQAATTASFDVAVAAPKWGQSPPALRPRQERRSPSPRLCRL